MELILIGDEMVYLPFPVHVSGKQVLHFSA